MWSQHRFQLISSHKSIFYICKGLVACGGGIGITKQLTIKLCKLLQINRSRRLRFFLQQIPKQCRFIFQHVGHLGCKVKLCPLALLKEQLARLFGGYTVLTMLKTCRSVLLLTITTSSIKPRGKVLTPPIGVQRRFYPLCTHHTCFLATLQQKSLHSRRFGVIG